MEDTDEEEEVEEVQQEEEEEQEEVVETEVVSLRLQLREAQAEVKSLKGKVRRDKKIAELKKLVPESPNRKARQAWSPEVVLLAMTLRSAGMGVRTTGRVVSFIFLLLAAIVCSMVAQP